MWISELAVCTHLKIFTIGGKRRKLSKMNEYVWKIILENTGQDLGEKKKKKEERSGIKRNDESDVVRDDIFQKCQKGFQR